jgi:hypothetical protein
MASTVVPAAPPDQAGLRRALGSAVRAPSVYSTHHVAHVQPLERQQEGHAAELARWTGRCTGAGDGISAGSVAAGIGKPGEIPILTAVTCPARPGDVGGGYDQDHEFFGYRHPSDHVPPGRSHRSKGARPCRRRPR